MTGPATTVWVPQIVPRSGSGTYVVGCASVREYTPNLHLDFGAVTRRDPEAVGSRSDFAAFARALSEADATEWENPNTAEYLESLAAWVEDWPDNLEATWSDFAKALLAATVYE